MNKLRYRVIFNEALGVMMAVSELAKSHLPGTSDPAEGTKLPLSSFFNLKRLTWMTGLLFGNVLLVNTTMANIVADPNAPGNQKPIVIQSANGTPQVNIQTPSAAGVSRNKYSQFDVNGNGAILNNSRKPTQTELAGWVDGNQWLATGEARIILNEVNSRDPSKLNGFVEVAGKKAQVIIANPAGITCEGCGFINSDRATLTTGQVQTQNGAVTGYQVNDGKIVIQGRGMDSTRQDQTDLIARAVEINAGVWANDLKVTTGQNQVDAGHTKISKTSTQNASNKPTVAIDVSDLGGMYAGKIRLVGTEQGVGVRNTGEIGASAGSVTLTADGKLVNSGTINSQQNIQITTTEDIVNTGKQYANNTQTLQSGKQINNQGVIAANRDLVLASDSLESNQNSVIAAGIASTGKLTDQGNLTITTTGKLNAHGQNLAAGTLTFSGDQLDLSESQTYADTSTFTAQRGDIDTQRSTVSANKVLNANTLTTLNNRDGNISANQLLLNAAELDNSRGYLQQLGGNDLTLSMAQGINNTAGHIANNGDNLLIKSALLDNTSGEILLAGKGNLVLDVDTINGQSGALLTNGALSLHTNQLNLNGATTAAQQITLSADSFSHRGGEMHQFGSEPMHLQVNRLFDNTSGLINSNGTITLLAGTLDNTQGAILTGSNQDLQLSIDGLLTNTDGLLHADRDLTLTTDKLINTSGEINALQGDATIKSHQEIDNVSGVMRAKNRLTLSANGLNNQQGLLYATNNQLQLGTFTLNNHEGTIASLEHLMIESGFVDNTLGWMQADDFILDTQGMDLDNHEGTLVSSGKFTLSTQALHNQSGNISSGRDSPLLIKATQIDNDLGQIYGGDITLSLQGGRLTNSQGEIVAENALKLHSGEVDNQTGWIQSGGALDLNTGLQSLNNTSGVILSESSLNVSTGKIDNQDGYISSKHDAHINSTDFANLNGQLLSDQNLYFNNGLATLDNQFGVIAAKGDLQVTSGLLLNQQGLLQSGGNATFDTHQYRLENTTGDIVSLGDLSITTKQFDNQSGNLQTLGNLTLRATDSINNTDGLLIAENAVLNAGKGIDNTNGLLKAGNAILNAGNSIINTNGLLATDDLTLNATKAIDNAKGMIVAEQAKLNASENIDNTDGLLSTTQSLILHANQVINRQNDILNGGIEGKQITIIADSLDNSTGAIVADDSLTLAIQSALNNHSGILSANQTLNIGSRDLLSRSTQPSTLRIDNQSGQIIAGDALNLTTQSIMGEGELLSLADMALTVQGDYVHNGSLLANGNLTLNTQGSLTNYGVIRNGEKLDLHAHNLENTEHAEITAGSGTLAIDNQFTNTGLIDGGILRIETNQLDNLGTGRIYGDYLSIAAQTLNNFKQDDKSAVIAARGSLNLGVQTLNNREDALIFSAGSLALGGALDDKGYATGEAGLISNRSARIESLGDMALNAQRIENLNDHLTTQIVEISRNNSNYLILNGQTVQHDWSGIPYYNDKYGVRHVITPTGESDTFMQYQYQTVVNETQVIESKPGEIISGGNLWITADSLLNKDSQILAGDNLIGEINNLQNVATEGKRITTENGTATRWYAKKKKRPIGGTKTSQGQDFSPINNTRTDHIDLKTLAYEGNANGHNSGYLVESRSDTHSSVNTDQFKQLQTQANVPSIEINYGTIESASSRPLNLPAGQRFELALPPDPNYPNAPNSVIRITAPNTQLPTSSLYQINPDNQGDYLIATDPRFTDRKMWLGSDYMLAAFNSNHDVQHKRLGDAYYEQQLIKDQVISLTGNRYLADYSDDEEQYKALMDAGIKFGQAYQLVPGVALSPEQMALLTEDIVWLVTQTITLPNGTQESVLVPQVYAKVQAGDLDGSGALLSAKNLLLKTDTVDNSGTLNAKKTNQIVSNDILNTGKIRGGDITLVSTGDITNLGGTIVGKDSITAIAGRDITSKTTVNGAQNNTHLDKIAGIAVQNDSGQLILQADRDINLIATQVVNQGANSDTIISAGNNLNLGTVTTTKSEHFDFGKTGFHDLAESHEIGTEIFGNGNVLLNADNDLMATAASINAADHLQLQAQHDITIQAGQDTLDLTDKLHQSSRGLFSSQSSTRIAETHNQTSVASQLNGDTITMIAGNNLTVAGSDVIADNDLNIKAGNDVNITTADEHYSTQITIEEKKSGLMGGGGLGVFIGSQSQKTDDTTQDGVKVGSTLGSLNGDVNVVAGNKATFDNSDVIAKQDINVVAKDIFITAAANTHDETHITESKSTGLTLSLGGSVGGALNSAVSTASQIKHDNSDRKNALLGVSAGLSVAQGVQDLRLAGATDTNPNQAGVQSDYGSTIGINASFGSQSSRSEQTIHQVNHDGSVFDAGGNINLTATEKDIRIENGTLDAGNNINLDAARDVLLLGKQDTTELSGKNESNGWSIGGSLDLSGGWGLNASVNKGRGSESGNTIINQSTLLNANNLVKIKSGNDTQIINSQVKGDGIVLEVGNNLRIESLQDSDVYHSSQTNMGLSLSGGLGMIGGGINADRTKMDSNYASVNEQAGLFAGQKGLDVDVANNTHLKGGAMTSEGENNSLSTGTLTFEDIQNKADFTVSGNSAGLNVGNGGLSLPTVSNGNHSGSAENTTKATVGNNIDITIRDETNQTQDIATLNRDTDNANQPLDKIFDKEKEQSRLDEQKLIADIGNQLSTIVRTEGQIRAEQAKNDPQALKQAEQELLLEGKTPTEEDIKQRAENNAMQDWGTGGKYQQITQAVTGALQGLLGGDLTQALANGSAPFLAEAIKNATTNPDGSVNKEANLAAHAILGALLSQANGNNALAGGLAALTAEAAAQLIKDQLYGDKSFADLTESERQNISALAQIAAAVAGGLAGDSTSDTAQGALAGKNAVENNYLKLAEKQELSALLAQLKNTDDPAEREKLLARINAINEADLLRNEEFLAACKGALASSADCQNLRAELIAAKLEYEQSGNYNSKAKDIYNEAYTVFVSLLAATTQDAQNSQAVREGLINLLMDDWGYDKETAIALVNAKDSVNTLASVLAMTSLSKNLAGAGLSEKDIQQQLNQILNTPTGRRSINNRLAVDEEAAGWSQYDKYRNADGSWNWPKELGFANEPTKTTLPIGTRLDRYGEPDGSFLSPKGTPYEERALSPGTRAQNYYEYEVIKPLPVIKGQIAPAFGEPGGGVQILPNIQNEANVKTNVNWLLKNKYIREVD